MITQPVALPIALYSTYQSFVTQTGTSVPVGVLIKNDFLPTTFTWGRTSAGVYTLTTNAATFTSGKTVALLSNPLLGLVQYTAVVTSTTVITITTGLVTNVATVATSVATDVLFSNTLLEVRVYT